VAAARNDPPARSGSRQRGLRAGAAIALAAGVLPPIALLRLPGAFAALALPYLATAVVAALALAAASVGVALLLYGFDGMLRRLEGSRKGEPRFAILRLFIAAALFAYTLRLALLAPSKAAAAVVLSACAALVYAWLFLLLLILVPRPLRLRPLFATLADSGVSTLVLYAGGSLTAFFYPVYLLLALGNGFRFGLKSLILATLANTLGFAVVVATTPFWRAEPALASGLLVALILVAASAVPFLRPFAGIRAQKTRATGPETLALPAPSIIRAREEETAKATTSELLRLFAEEARRAGEAVLRLAAGFGEEKREPAQRERAHTLEAHARALLSRLDDMRDLGLAAIAELEPESEVFDLYEVAFAALAMLSAEAAAKGQKLSLRVDPRLPYRLVGWSRLFRQILLALMAGALASSETGNLRIEIGAAGRGSGRIRYRIAIRRHGGPAVRPAGFPIVARLVERMGGHLSADGSSLDLPFALAEEPAAEVDLGRRLVLIASEDGEFAEGLLAWLKAFNARGETIGLSEAALREVVDKSAEQPVLIVDGRSALLPALSFAYRAAAGERAAVLFVANEPHWEPLASIADDLLAAILPAPLAKRVLAAALHAVRAARHEAPAEPAGETARTFLADSAAEPSRAENPRARPQREASAAPAAISATAPPTPPVPVVTSITSHPRFGGDREIVVEERTIAALRALGEGSDFFASVLDAFRTDSAAIFEELRRAAEAADLGGFREALQALKSCAASLGGVRLVELLSSLREVTAGELRLEGKGLVDRIGAELIRLEAALDDTLVRGAGRQ
jgi:signal transduction histidine kinase/HPt (histidine-containing phosphotransfer) domain-containing protein